MGRRKKTTQLDVMTSPEQAFINELEVFRTESESAAQFFYAYLGIHAIAGDRKEVYRYLNTEALFWNTSLGARRCMKRFGNYSTMVASRSFGLCATP